MQDVTIALDDQPGSLALLGETLGRAGISVEGGGAFVVRGAGERSQGVGHFLFHDGPAARQALEAAGLRVLAVRDVVTLRLRQAIPGQLGLITRSMASAGVNIEVLYSDHANQLILVVDNPTLARTVADSWTKDHAHT
jgi:hypothetical protein